MMGGGASKLLGKRSTAKQVVEHFSNGNSTFLAGKVAVVTGGNSGIGLETCKSLSSAGCRVIMGSRKVSNGEAAIATEVEQAGHGKYTVPNAKELIFVRELDLESLCSIKSFAEECAREPRIDYLILNAGVMAVAKLELTPHGFERQIGTNHFGHHYLVSLLKPKMVAQRFPSRIVALSSAAAIGADYLNALNTDDLHFRNRPYGAWTSYCQSKVANALMVKSLADELTGTLVTAVCLHPGVIRTNLQAHLSPLVTWMTSTFAVDKSIPQGAATTVTAALDPALDSCRGAYLEDCAVSKSLGKVGTDADGKGRVALWNATEAQLKEALAAMK